MSQVFHASEIVPVDDHIPLELRSLDELHNIRETKQQVLAQLEGELYWLEQPSNLEMRITLLEGAVQLAEGDETMDRETRSKFLRKFVEDLREDHNGFDHGKHARKLPHGVVLDVADHPMLMQGKMESEMEEFIKRNPSMLEPHPAIGQPGLFAEQYHLMPDPWIEKGFDYTKEVPGRTPWHQGQEVIDQMVAFDDWVAEVFQESYVGQCCAMAQQSIIDTIPESVKEAFTPEEVKLVKYGCGDVFVDKRKAKIAGRCLRSQMASAGQPVYGETVPVTKKWFDENVPQQNLEKKYITPPPDSAVMRAIAGP